ncbi:6-O-methylguanine DNA methyltransferase [Siminovitchia terrae]|uniref:6-O-methylguanine DNA methyltransferase n=2 Tax=Siminovitchia terrae TaxID=1914933 RepID=A0A429X6Q8_SIMTE|nr:MGMT family protein [Siminovitchia terrae]RST59052.1 MGMT family protein [Siminovitchia terrae]GIN92316.1 6-O-methylguanine DNA methyltransferase [Siminovitchia terrae]GIN96649.1 6-O-methylguanine DNA methyltransferase [Siminovitchia terrae]
MNHFTEKVIDTILQIPAGRVASYGQIATFAGNHRAARQVGRILHSMSEKYNLPWHRVVNTKGEIVLFKADKQRQLLEQEGIELNENGRIDMKTFRWEGPAGEDMDWMRG